jgi:hypothetical protein
MLTVMFRDLHTIKGTASFLDLPRITSLAHAAEDLMARMRDGVLAPDREISGMLLRVVDVLRTMITEARATGAPMPPRWQPRYGAVRCPTRSGSPQVSTRMPRSPTPCSRRASDWWRSAASRRGRRRAIRAPAELSRRRGGRPCAAARGG